MVICILRHHCDNMADMLNMSHFAGIQFLCRGTKNRTNQRFLKPRLILGN